MTFRRSLLMLFIPYLLDPCVTFAMAFFMSSKGTGFSITRLAPAARNSPLSMSPDTPMMGPL